MVTLPSKAFTARIVSLHSTPKPSRKYFSHYSSFSAHMHGNKFRAVAYSKKDEKKKKHRVIEEASIREEGYMSTQNPLLLEETPLANEKYYFWDEDNRKWHVCMPNTASPPDLAITPPSPNSQLPVQRQSSPIVMHGPGQIPGSSASNKMPQYINPSLSKGVN